MKNFIWLLILTAGMVSCSSDGESGVDNPQLIGNWNWISSCGGFIADCWFSNENNTETLTFTENVYIKKINDVVETETSYTIVDRITNGDNILFVM